MISLAEKIAISSGIMKIKSLLLRLNSMTVLEDSEKIQEIAGEISGAIEQIDTVFKGVCKN